MWSVLYRQGEAFENAIGFVVSRSRMLRPYSNYFLTPNVAL